MMLELIAWIGVGVLALLTVLAIELKRQLRNRVKELEAELAARDEEDSRTHSMGSVQVLSQGKAREQRN